MQGNAKGLADIRLIANELERLLTAYRQSDVERNQRRVADYLDEYSCEILAALRSSQSDRAAEMRERAAKVAEADRRTPLAREYNYQASFHVVGREISAEIRALPLSQEEAGS